MENTDAPETGPSEETPIDRKPRNRGRRAWFWLRGVWLLAMIPVVFALIAAVTLIDREITAPSWVKNRLADRAELALAGGSVRFEAIKLVVGSDLHPRVRLHNAVLTDAAGQDVARVDQIAGLLSPRGVLFEGKALLQDITLTGAQFDLRRDATGALAWSFGDGGATYGAVDPADLLAQLDAAFARPELEALETIRAEDLVISLADARTGQTWAGQSEAIDLDLRGEERRLTASLAVRGTAAEMTTVAFDLTNPKDGSPSDVSLSVSDISARDVAAQADGLAWLGGVDAPASLSMQTRIASDGTLDPVAVRLSLEEGTIAMPGIVAPLALTEAVADVILDPQAGIAQIEAMSVRSELAEFDANGQFLLEESADGPPQMIGQLAFANIRTLIPGLFEEDLTFDGAHLDVRFRREPLRIDLGQLTITDPVLPLRVTGQIEQGDAGWITALDAYAPKLSRNAILAHWPLDRAPKARAWLSSNLLTGEVTEVNGGLRLRVDEAPQWSLGFGFQDAELRILRDTPHIKEATGFANIQDGNFALSMMDGHITAAQGGRIELAGSTVTIPDMRIKGGPLNVALDGESTITAVLSVLEASPIRLMQRAQLPVAVADGRAAVRGTIEFPRRNPVDPDTVRYDVRADLSRVSSRRLIPDRVLEAAALRLEVDNAGLNIVGRARLDGVPLRGRYDQTFGDPTTRVSADVGLSQASLDAFGIALPPGSVSGEGTGRLDLALRRGAPPAFTLTSDLRGLRVSVPAVGWSKSPDTEGALSVTGTLGARAEVTELRISGGGLFARGSVALSEQGGFQAARFRQLQIGNWFNAPVTLRGRGAGRAPAVEIAGGTLDLRQARLATSGGTGGNGGPVAIALDRLQVTQGIALDNFRGEFSGAGGFSGTFTGNVNGGPEVRGTVVPQDGRSAIRLQSEDAGGVARAAGFVRGAAGGRLDVTMTPTGGEGTFNGALSIRSIRLRDAPTMAALLDAISVIGLLQQLDGQGLAFDEVDARFRLTPTQVVLSEASAVGPGLGISLDGIYTLASKQMDFQGVISPLYLINGIGSFLTRKGEGLIGFNFTVRGDAAAPNVGVNPLSALTPGMFREIFRRPPPVITQ